MFSEFWLFADAYLCGYLRQSKGNFSFEKLIQNCLPHALHVKRSVNEFVLIVNRQVDAYGNSVFLVSPVTSSHF